MLALCTINAVLNDLDVSYKTEINLNYIVTDLNAVCVPIVVKVLTKNIKCVILVINRNSVKRY